MSRRRVSIRDLGEVDCQGWLQRRKDGRSFLGSKWKRYWFVLKKSSLYWYSDRMAQAAEGFINLSGFTVEQTKGCRKKHTITASRPHVVTVFMAADSFTDMNKWISKLCEAAEPRDLLVAEECYSEGSDQDGDDCGSTSCSPDSELDLSVPENTNNQPLSESLSCSSIPTASMTTDSRTRTRTSSASGTLSGHRRRAGLENGSRLSWLDLLTSEDAGGAAAGPLLTEERQGKPPDEMESLYTHLKEARLSPMGQKDFRASFIRRCQNEQINEKLHLLRILSSTLKAKELDLQAVDQILNDPTLTAPSYRKWKLSNLLLLEATGAWLRSEALISDE